MTAPLNSLPTVKSFLNIRDTNTDYDALLPILSGAATKQISEALNLALQSQTHTEVFNTRRSISVVHDLTGNSETGLDHRSSRQGFYLSGVNIDTGVEIAVFYDPQGSFGDDTKLGADDYRLDAEEGHLTLLAGTGDYVKALKVVYAAGFSVADGHMEASAPDDMKLAHLYQTAFMFKRHRPDNIGMRGDQAVMGEKTKRPAARWNADQGLCKEAAGLLASYRRPVMGRG